MNRWTAFRYLGYVCLTVALLLRFEPASAATCEGMAGGPGDLDGDGHVAVGDDCDDTDPGVWARTQAVGQVKLAKVSGAALITWLPIIDTGGSSATLTYEIVRSRVPSNFATHPTATCLDPGGTELQFTDAAVPPPGGVFYYLVRGRNECGPGSSGTRSNGTPRDVKDCAFSVVCNDANTCTTDSASNGACTHTAIPPTIIHGPSSIGVCTGDVARFWVEASNETSTHYAWKKNGVPVGVDSPNLVLPPATLGDNHHTVTVTVQDACGSVNTDDAFLTVFSDPNACEGGLSGPPAPNGASDPQTSKSWLPSNFRGPKGLDGTRVNLHSGELEYAATDMEIPGRGFDFVFTRYNRSREWTSTPVGVGWRHSYDRHAVGQNGGVVIFNPMSGSDFHAAPPPGGSCYVAPAGGFEELCPQPDGTLALTFPNGDVWTFHALDASSTSGLIVQARDVYGNAMSFSYDTVGKLTTILDTLGRPITFTYNARNLIDSITDFTGSSVHYAYYNGFEPGGELDDLKSVTSPPITGTPTGNDFPQGRTTTYTYSNGFALGEENHNLMSVTGPDGKTYARFSYNLTDNQNDHAFDRVNSMVLLDGTASHGEMFTYVALTPSAANDFAVSKTIVKDATNHRSDYFYNAQAQLVRVVDSTGVLPDSAFFASDLDNVPGPPDTPGDPPTIETKIHYDTNSLITSLTMPSLATVDRVYDSANPSVAKRGDLLSETFHPGPLGGDQTEITRSWTYATPLGTDWAARGDVRIVHPPGTPPGTWRRISDVRIVHPPGTPPGTWRRISDVRIVHPPATPPGATGKSASVSVTASPGGTSAAVAWTKMHPKLYQEGVDPFASQNAGAEDPDNGGCGSLPQQFDYEWGLRRISDVRIVHPPGTPPGTWRTNGDGKVNQHAGEQCDNGLGNAADKVLTRGFCPSELVRWRSGAAGKVSAITSRFGKCVATDSGDFRVAAAPPPFTPWEQGNAITKVSAITSRFGKCVATDSGDFKYRVWGEPLDDDDDGDGIPTIDEDCAREVSPGHVVAVGTARDRHLAFGGTLPSAGFPTSATDENGQTYTFTYDTSGFLTDLQAPTVVTGTLSGAPQTIHYHWDRNPYGQIVAYTDPASQVSTLDWSSSGPDNGYLRALHVPAGTLTAGYQYTFSLRGRLTGITDPLGHTTTFTLNGDDDIVRVTEPAPLSYQTDFYYDINGLQFRTDVQNLDENGVLQPNHHLSTFVHATGLQDKIKENDEVTFDTCVSTEYDYDPVGRLTKVRGGVTSPGPDPGMVTELTYGRIKVRFPTLVESKDQNGSLWVRKAFDMDHDGRVTAMHDGIGPAAMLAHTTFDYDGYGRTTKITDPEGNESSLHYDAASNVVSSRLDGELTDGSSGPNVKLAECTALYDEIGRNVQCECSHLRRATGAPIGDGHDLSLGFYDEQSNVIRTQDDNGHGFTYTYAPGRRLSQIQDDINNVQSIECNLDGSVQSVTETSAGSPGNPPLSTTTHFEYDALGRTTAIVDPSGGRTEAKYDSQSFVVRLKDAMGNVARYTQDGRGLVVQARYDMTDTGDGTGNVIATHTTSQTWNDLGQVTSTTDAEGNTSSYQYDGGGRLSQKTAPDGTHTSLVWSPRSNLVSATDQNGSVSTFTNDKLGRVTDVSIARAPGVGGTTSEHFAYDGAGSLVSASDDDSLVTRTYDSHGLMLSETQQITGVPPRTMTIERDNTGNPTSIVYPSGHSVSYGLDPLDRTQVVLADGAFVAFYEYLGASRLSRMFSGNMVGTEFTYDASGRLEQKSVSGSNGSVYVAQVNWDNVRLDSRTEPVFGTTTTYDYDSLDRLVKSTTTSSGPVDERIYSLSAMGDRVLVIGGLDAGPYSRNPTLPEPADLQMHQYTSTPSGTRTHDKNGNTLTMHGGTPSQLSMTYDADGNIVTGGGVTFGQDAFGRYLLRAGVPLRSWTYGPGGALEQYDGATLEATFVRGAGGELLRMIEDADINGNGVLDTYTYHTDDEGNVRALTDQSGATVELYNYDDFGNPSIYANPSTPIPFSLTGNPFLYRSMMWDPAMKLYRIRGGAYDSRIGRGTSRPLVAQGGHRVAPLHDGLESCGNVLGASGTMQVKGEFQFSPPGSSNSTPGTVIHWTLEVRVDRIEMK